MTLINVSLQSRPWYAMLTCSFLLGPFRDDDCRNGLLQTDVTPGAITRTTWLLKSVKTHHICTNSTVTDNVLQINTAPKVGSRVLKLGTVCAYIGHCPISDPHTVPTLGTEQWATVASPVKIARIPPIIAQAKLQRQ